MSDIKIVIGAQDSIDAYQEQVDVLLAILEHPEAFVTDESSFADFLLGIQQNPLRLGTKEERQRELDMLLEDGGITTKIGIFDTLIEGVKKILAENPDWPDRKIQ